MKEFSGLTNATGLSHAYIADAQLAGELAMAAVCTGSTGTACGCCKDCEKAAKHMHPDIITIKRRTGKNGKERSEIVIDQIRELKNGGDIESAYVLPNEAGRKAYIIKDAETMNKNAQNALLQLLEEPPAHVVFILSTANPHALLPTVRSRCVELRPGQTPAAGGSGSAADGGQPDDLSEAEALADDFIAALGNNKLLVESMLRLGRAERQVIAGFIPQLRSRLAGLLRDEKHRRDAVTVDALLTKASEMLELNVNTGHISAMLHASLLKEN